MHDQRMINGTVLTKLAPPPSTADSPLVVFVHGRAGTIDIMSPFRRAVPDGTGIVSVQAPLPDAIGGFSWWEVVEGEHATSSIANAEEGATALESAIRSVLHVERLQPRKLLAFGFSQGAAVLSVLIQKFPEFFDAVALLAGFVIPLPHSRSDGPFPKIAIVHGTEDMTVTVDRAREGERFLRMHGYSVDYFDEPVAHKVGTQGMRFLRGWTEEILAVL